MPAATAPASSRRNWNGCRGTWQPLATSKMPLEQISRPAQGASMSTILRTGISPAFSDAVVAELRAAINNNAPSTKQSIAVYFRARSLLGSIARFGWFYRAPTSAVPMLGVQNACDWLVEKKTIIGVDTQRD